MPALQVREFPEELYEDLKRCAARNHRSIAQQTIACVESDLARRDVQLQVRRGGLAGEGALEGAQEPGENEPAAVKRQHAWDNIDFDPDDIPIPARVKEASARARFVSPWCRSLDIEPDEVLEARRKKREKLFREIDEMNASWEGPRPTGDDIVRMIREDRDGNHGHLLPGIDY